MSNSKNPDEEIRQAALALLRVADFGSARHRPQACVDAIMHVLGSESLVFCRVGTRLSMSKRHLYLATCGNVILGCFDVGILKCPMKHIKTSETDYWMDTSLPHTHMRAGGGKLHRVFQLLRHEGASVIITVPILAAAETLSEKAVDGLLTCAWSVEDPMLALKFLPTMQALAAEMSETFVARMKPLVDETEEYFLHSPSAPALDPEHTRAAAQEQPSCKLWEDKNADDSHDDGPPSGAPVKIHTPIQDVRTPGIGTPSVPTPRVGTPGVPGSGLGLPAVPTPEFATPDNPTREPPTPGVLDPDIPVPTSSLESPRKSIAVRAGSGCAISGEASGKPSGHLASKSFNCRGNSPSKGFKSGGNFPSISQSKVKSPGCLPEMGSKGKLQSCGKDKVCADRHQSGPQVAHGPSALDPVRLTFEDPSLEMLFKLHFASHNMRTDLGWTVFFIFMIGLVWDSEVTRMPWIRAAAVSYAFHAICIILAPSWYRRHREIFCLLNSSGTRVLFALGWMWLHDFASAQRECCHESHPAITNRLPVMCMERTTWDSRYASGPACCAVLRSSLPG
eukprot:jgi/Botrbrau1/11511/Bobra.0198s0008.1